jgi:hypothetical protein
VALIGLLEEAVVEHAPVELLALVEMVAVFLELLAQELLVLLLLILAAAEAERV